ncbi:hypothetical protein GH714_013288 [Hevea brasiliensis]|uniref:Ubiquitin receptor RAD23 n=1 Tax=Hevea brasiliensis TaxID=3981 RepID=A0A6A6MNJ5_HEVBR|nr:hypothetical protein GH714_013288 [Hevea brasiliensis]
MKVFVKTLKGTNFEIEVKPEDTVADVKKSIETVQGADIYPAAQQMLIHQGKVLKDGTTLEENKVAENSFIVIMLSKSKVSSSGASTASAAPPSQAQPASSLPTSATQPATTTQAPAPTAAPLQPSTESTPSVVNPVSSESDIYGHAASNLVAGNNLEATIQQILDMGGGSWDRKTVVHALRAALTTLKGLLNIFILEFLSNLKFNQLPEFLLVGRLQIHQPILNNLQHLPVGLPSMGSNASAGTLDFLRNSQQFQALRAMVQANPQILQPMIQELGKQNPHLMRLIQEHQADFLRLINEPVEGEGNPLSQLASAMPQAVTVTPEEREAIERLEAMGFDRALVLEVFIACNKNEELAANYLLDHIHEFEE